MDYDSVTINNLDELIEKEYSNINGIIIRRDNAVVFEKYFGDFMAADTALV